MISEAVSFLASSILFKAFLMKLQCYSNNKIAAPGIILAVSVVMVIMYNQNKPNLWLFGYYLPKPFLVHGTNELGSL